MSLALARLRRSVAMIVAVGVCAGAAGQPSALPKNSPFMPAAGPGQAAAAGEVIEFAGVSSVGKRTDLAFYDKAAKKSRWVGIGETKDGIELIRYDPRREQAVIKHNGVEKILTLRKGSAVSGSSGAPGMQAMNPAPVPMIVAPTASPLVMSTPNAPAASTPEPQNPPPGAKPPPPAIPEAQQKQEMEARMLVSDLLEIGMAQRRAYEEAQRKASETAPTTPAPDAPKQP